ncbi:MAG: trigger factor [Defluviitaleaceae bacterium]|nr:trigger factor [Defluviitaleaceae bacterium]
MAKKKTKIEPLKSSEIEQLEPCKFKLTLTVGPERLREGLTFAYNRSKQYFNIPGFRRGKAPRKIIEQAYGKEVFYDDALNHIMPDAYEEALDKHELEPVHRPEIDTGDISETDGLIFFATVVVRPAAEIGEYGGLAFPKTETDATEEDIEAALKAEQEKNSRQVSVNRAAEMNDVVTMNFEGFIDDEPFDGGKGEDFDLVLGSGQFIPGFEEQLVGAKVGDDIDVNVTFPDDYHAPEFASKSAVFKTEILDVKANELPEIDDEFAEDVSEFDTLAEFKDDLAKRIKEGKEANLVNMKRAHLLKKLIDVSTVEIPEEMYLGRLEDMFRDFSHNIHMRGMDVENYMRFTQTSEEFLKASWRKQAEVDVKGMLALEAVAIKEGLTVDEETFEQRVKDATGKEGDELAKIIEDMHPARRKELERSLLCEKAMDFVTEKAVESEDEEFDPEATEMNELPEESENSENNKGGLFNG